MALVRQAYLDLVAGFSFFNANQPQKISSLGPIIFENMKSRFSFVLLFCLLIHLVSCSDSSTNSGNDEGSSPEKEQVEASPAPDSGNDVSADSQAELSSKASNFLDLLQKGELLSSLFSDDWTFVYHEDNRVEGSTDGQVEHLKSGDIDASIKIEVSNDGEGWDGQKKEPKTYEMEFSLKDKVASWDRFEVQQVSEKDENMVSVAGSGASDYINLHYGEDGMIAKLEYRSEDPG